MPLPVAARDDAFIPFWYIRRLHSLQKIAGFGGWYGVAVHWHLELYRQVYP